MMGYGLPFKVCFAGNGEEDRSKDAAISPEMVVARIRSPVAELEGSESQKLEVDWLWGQG